MDMNKSKGLSSSFIQKNQLDSLDTKEMNRSEVKGQNLTVENLADSMIHTPTDKTQNVTIESETPVGYGAKMNQSLKRYQGSNDSHQDHMLLSVTSDAKQSIVNYNRVSEVKSGWLSSLFKCCDNFHKGNDEEIFD